MISNTKTYQWKGNGGNPPLNAKKKNYELLKNNVSHISLKEGKGSHLGSHWVSLPWNFL
jgi:hypothetical protein